LYDRNTRSEWRWKMRLIGTADGRRRRRRSAFERFGAFLFASYGDCNPTWGMGWMYIGVGL
jgi:hypothetical protein